MKEYSLAYTFILRIQYHLVSSSTLQYTSVNHQDRKFCEAWWDLCHEVRDLVVVSIGHGCLLPLRTMSQDAAGKWEASRFRAERLRVSRFGQVHAHSTVHIRIHGTWQAKSPHADASPDAQNDGRCRSGHSISLRPVQVQKTQKNQALMYSKGKLLQTISVAD